MSTSQALKSLKDYYFTRGDLVRLNVVCFNGVVKFQPVFLNEKEDGYIPFNERSMRIPLPAHGVNLPIINEGEIWQAKIKAVQLRKLQYRTTDGRCFVNIFLEGYKRIETQKRIRIFDSGYIEVWSGDHLIDDGKSNPIKLTEKKEEFISGDQIMVVYSYHGPDDSLFGNKLPTFCDRSYYISKLKQNNIDPVAYFKKLNKMVA